MIFNTKVTNTKCECNFSRNRHQYWFWDRGFMDESCCAVIVSSRRPQMEVNNPCSLLGAPNPVEPLFFRAPAILARSLSLSLAERLGSSISQACSWCSMQICHHHKVQDEALLHFTRCSAMQCRRISAADPLLVIIIDRKKPGDQGPGIRELLLLIAQIRADTDCEQIRERGRSIDGMCADLFAFLYSRVYDIEYPVARFRLSIELSRRDL